MMHFILTTLLVLPLSVFAGAPRTVKISSDGQLKLVNPSGATVTYSLTCKDKNGTTLLTESSQTLAAGVTRSIGANNTSTACATGMNLNASTTYMTNGAATCNHNSMGSISHPSAATWCAPGHHICSIADITTVRSGNAYGFIAAPSTWSFSTDGGSTWTNTTNGVGGHIAVLDSMGSSSNRCATGAGGTGAAINACMAWTYGDPMNSNNPWNMGSIACCPDIVGLSYCSVTIESATPTGGHLISPQFKGGSAF